jgi:hypothetical protein
MWLGLIACVRSLLVWTLVWTSRWMRSMKRVFWKLVAKKRLLRVGVRCGAGETTMGLSATWRRPFLQALKRLFLRVVSKSRSSLFVGS